MPAKIKRTYSRCRKTTNDQFVQTEDDALLKLSSQLLNDLQKRGPCSNEATPEDLIRRQIILSSHIKKLSKENSELKDRLEKMNLKFSLILDKLRIYKTENDANRRNLLDNLAVLNLNQNNAKKQLNEQINKYYTRFETEQQKSLNKIKVKESKLTKIKSEKEEINFQLQNVLNAFQVQSRLLEVARKEAFNAREENKETGQKLLDKLYLKTNQRCTNCEVKQKVQSNLTDQIAELKNKIVMKEQEIAERSRINTIFAEKLKKDKEEFNKKELLSKKELEKANNLKRTYCDKLREYQTKLIESEAEKFRISKALENNERNGRASSISRQLMPEPSGLTPPEEVDKSPSIQTINSNSDTNMTTTNNSNQKEIKQQPSLNNTNKNKEQQTGNNSSQKDNVAPPPEKMRKTTSEVARGWKAVLDLADSLDSNTRQNKVQPSQPRMPGVTTNPRMPAKTIPLTGKSKNKKKHSNNNQQPQQNPRIFQGSRLPPPPSSSITWRSGGIRVHENFNSQSKEQSMMNRSLQNEAMFRQKAAQQTRQQPAPLNRFSVTQPGTSNRQQDNFTVNRDQLPWHGTIIKQQTPPEPTPLYRSFW
ncbi:hypothetical protein ACQ4LE_003138 [Meloidogyne hapla]